MVKAQGKMYSHRGNIISRVGTYMKESLDVDIGCHDYSIMGKKRHSP